MTLRSPSSAWTEVEVESESEIVNDNALKVKPPVELVSIIMPHGPDGIGARKFGQTSPTGSSFGMGPSLENQQVERMRWTTFGVGDGADVVDDDDGRRIGVAPIQELGRVIPICAPGFGSGAGTAVSSDRVAFPTSSSGVEGGRKVQVKHLPPLPSLGSTDGTGTTAAPSTMIGRLPSTPGANIASGSSSSRPRLPSLSIPTSPSTPTAACPTPLHNTASSPIRATRSIVQPGSSLWDGTGKGKAREGTISRSDEGHGGLARAGSRADTWRAVEGSRRGSDGIALFGRRQVSAFERGVAGPDNECHARPPNPLGHTYGNSSSPSSSHQLFATSKRRRAATFNHGPSETMRDRTDPFPESVSSPFANPALSRRNSIEFGWKPGVGVVQLPPDFMDHRDGLNGGMLPPGAYPASDPAASTAFELSASGRYAALASSSFTMNGGIGGPPLGVVPIPRRTTSLSISTDERDSGPIGSDAYAYASSPTSRYSAHALSILGTGKPLVSPAISSRQAEVGREGFFANEPLASLLVDLDQTIGDGIRQVATSTEPAAGIAAAPHASTLLLDARTFSIALQQRGSSMTAMDIAAPGPASVPSMTDASSQSETPGHTPLTSASNSLSRSTKSGKEPDSTDLVVQTDETDAIPDVTLTGADVDPLGLAATLARRLRVADRRKCVLTEMLETEVAYRGHLRDMVEVYNPLLTSLAMISSETQATIMRNIAEVLALHETFCRKMLDIAVDERLGANSLGGHDQDDGTRTDRLVKRLADLFVETAPGFTVYATYCAEAAAALDAIRSVENRPEWIAFEKRCQAIVGTKLHLTLHQALAEGVPGFSIDSLPPPTLTGVSSRLMFRDLLILPVQRVCRYPFMLGALSLVTSSTPSAHPDRPFDLQGGSVSPVDRALAVMKDVAASADAANERSVLALRSAQIVQRLEVHPDHDAGLVEGLGVCRLAGPLEVVYHHAQLAPLVSPVKVKYLLGALYDGYFILAKVKKPTVYEIKHYLPLEMFELIDVTSGLLPHSIRLQLQEHRFEIAFNCVKEKAVWSDALCGAREAGLTAMAPFSRPCSVIVNMNRARRKSTMMMERPDGGSSFTSPVKRNSLFSHSRQNSLTIDVSRLDALDRDKDTVAPPSPSSPTFANFTREPMGMSSSATGPDVLLRRAAPAFQAVIDGNIADICSEIVLTARSVAMLENINAASPGRTARPGGPLRNRLSMRDPSVLVRRRSSFIVDARKSASSSPEMGTISTFATLARSGSTYGRKSVDRERLMKRNSASEVEVLSSSPVSLHTNIPRHLVSERPNLESIAGSSGNVSTIKSTRRDMAALRATPNAGGGGGSLQTGRSQSGSRLARSHPSSPAISAMDSPVKPTLRHQGSVPKDLAYHNRPSNSRSNTLPGIPISSIDEVEASASRTTFMGKSGSIALGGEPAVFVLGAGITNTPNASALSGSGSAASGGGGGGLTRSFSLRWLGGTLRRDRSSLSMSDFGGSSSSIPGISPPNQDFVPGSATASPMINGGIPTPLDGGSGQDLVNLVGRNNVPHSSSLSITEPGTYSCTSTSTFFATTPASRRNSSLSEGDFLTFSASGRAPALSGAAGGQDDATTTYSAPSVGSRSRTTSSAGSSATGGTEGEKMEPHDENPLSSTQDSHPIASQQKSHPQQQQQTLKRRKSGKFFTQLNRLTSINRGG